jgi:hypothetical protein
MTRRAISPPGIHTVGPYSPAILAGDFFSFPGKSPLILKLGLSFPGQLRPKRGDVWSKSKKFWLPLAAASAIS